MANKTMSGGPTKDKLIQADVDKLRAFHVEIADMRERIKAMAWCIGSPDADPGPVRANLADAAAHMRAANMAIVAALGNDKAAKQREGATK